MPQINFDELVTLADWTAALQSILDEAKTAIQSNDQGKKLELQDQLRAYIKRSPEKCEFLDNIAHKAIDDLFISVVGSALSAIDARNAELKKATAVVADVTHEAENDAKSIQFKTAIEVLTKAKAAVEKLKALEQQLAQPDQNLLDKIKALTDAISDLSGLLPH
jgi:hypothetical protein